MAFLPDGNILITEKLPEALRILNRQNVLSEPLRGLPALSSDPETGLLDVTLTLDFATSHRIFFTFFGYADHVVSPTNVARARLDNNTLRDVKVIFRSTPAKSNGNDLSAGTKTGGRLPLPPTETYLFLHLFSVSGRQSRFWSALTTPLRPGAPAATSFPERSK